MDKAFYDDIVVYLRDGAYRTGNSHSRFLVRQAAHRYSIYGRRLRQGSLVVLHEGEAFDVLRSLHLRKQLIRGPNFLASSTGRGTFPSFLSAMHCKSVRLTELHKLSFNDADLS